MIFVEREEDDTEHLGFGGGLAGPDLELARALVDEHLHPLNDVRAAFAGNLQQGCIEGVVDEIEDHASFPLCRLKGQRMGVAVHAARGGVDEHFKFAVRFSRGRTMPATSVLKP
jgi:hypothetical protein